MIDKRWIDRPDDAAIRPDCLMKFESQTPSRQFSIRALMIGVTVAGIAMLVGKNVYHVYFNQPDAVASLRLIFEPARATGNSGRVALVPLKKGELESGILKQLLLNDPAFQNIPAIKQSRNSRVWLNQHLSVHTFDQSIPLMFEVRFNLFSDEASREDRLAMVGAAADVIKAEASKSGIRAIVLARTPYK